MKRLFLITLLCCLVGTVQAQNTPEMEYTVTIKNPVSHLYDVELAVRGLRETNLSLSMPAWEPGVYTIRDFAKNVQDFRAVTARNQPLAAQQTDKQTWQITKQSGDDVTVHYQVFSNQ